MVDPISVSSTSPAQEVTRQTAPKSVENGAAFSALLEQLADRARELEKTSSKPGGADELAGAVEEAHGSLQDALHLIEAYRASVQQGVQPNRTGASSDAGGAATPGTAAK